MSTCAGTDKKLEIIVVGGSLGGLAAGLALKAIGYNVTILERNPTKLLHNQGAGANFFQGNIVHEKDMVQNMTSWDLAYYLMRANFDGVESDYTHVPAPVKGEGKATHLHGHKVTGVEEEGEQVRVLFETTDGKKGSILGDLCVAADGPGSTIRGIFQPEVERKYVGYCALRGTVPENEAPANVREAFQEKFSFFHGPGRQILVYLIPGVNGSIEPGERLLNFVYYTNFPEGEAFNEIMTDCDGTFHRITIPPGKVAVKAWQEQMRLARENLPPQFSDLVCQTKRPFVQAVTDVINPQNEYLNGKVVLIGDALAGFRPHTVASTSQAAFDAMVLADMLEGKLTPQEWRLETMAFARYIQGRGVQMGQRSQFERLPLSELIRDRDDASTPRKEERPRMIESVKQANGVLAAH